MDYVWMMWVGREEDRSDVFCVVEKNTDSCRWNIVSGESEWCRWKMWIGKGGRKWLVKDLFNYVSTILSNSAWCFACILCLFSVPSLCVHASEYMWVCRRERETVYVCVNERVQASLLFQSSQTTTPHTLAKPRTHPCPLNPLVLPSKCSSYLSSTKEGVSLPCWISFAHFLFSFLKWSTLGSFLNMPAFCSNSSYFLLSPK